MMSSQGSQLPEREVDVNKLPDGAHIAYLFSSTSEKQVALFRLVSTSLTGGQTFVIYIAGKQGIKGIRLSMKDIGIDVGSFEKMNRLRIVDSEEWYTNTGRRSSFKSVETIKSAFTQAESQCLKNGLGRLLVISEMDMLVRKGFFHDCEEFELSLGKTVPSLHGNILCAYDERELTAVRVTSPRQELARWHESVLP
jgi:hypothetical protein